MSNVKYNIICALLFVVGASDGWARTIYYGSETEVVKIRYPGPTLLRFDADVETISNAENYQISPTSDEDPNYANLSIKPRFTKGSQRVAFILSNGNIVRAKLVTVRGKRLEDLGESVDSIYEFKSKEQHLEKSKTGRAGKTITALELIKAIVRGDQVAGYSSRKVDKKVNSLVNGVSIKLTRIYTGSLFNGYVFRIKNKSKKKHFSINVSAQRLGEPNQAVFAYADKRILSPKEGDSTARLYVVAKPNSTYRDLVLPMAVVKRGN